MLWAITCYFNPSRYVTRLENYKAFRAHLNVPLVTVEASFDGHFELQPDEAEILVQRHAKAVLWQKERLLNVALDFLPQDCNEVAWIDCDVIFSADDWAERACDALRSTPLVQLFSERCDLRREATADPVKQPWIGPVTRSVASVIATGRAVPQDLWDPEAPTHRGSRAGLAWAARKSLLDQCDLYDACILGGGDRAMVCAALGEVDYGVRAMAMAGRQVEHYRLWATRFHAAVAGQVGYIDGRIFHLWHGELRDRRSGERRQLLRPFGFDPFTDIAPDAGGCWRWATDKPEMHEYVRSYFDSRREDGPVVDVSVPSASRQSLRG